jgi:hypothetical protein
MIALSAAAKEGKPVFVDKSAKVFPLYFYIYASLLAVILALEALVPDEAFTFDFA